MQKGCAEIQTSNKKEYARKERTRNKYNAKCSPRIKDDATTVFNFSKFIV